MLAGWMVRPGRVHEAYSALVAPAFPGVALAVLDSLLVVEGRSSRFSDLLNFLCDLVQCLGKLFFGQQRA
jgi:hypothetical protein